MNEDWDDLNGWDTLRILKAREMLDDAHRQNRLGNEEYAELYAMSREYHNLYTSRCMTEGKKDPTVRQLIDEMLKLLGETMAWHRIEAITEGFTKAFLANIDHAGAKANESGISLEEFFAKGLVMGLKKQLGVKP